MRESTMSNHLGDYIKARREALGLRRSEVVRRLGYANLSRGSRRLCDVEGGRWVNRDFLRRLMGVLQVGPEAVRELIDRDRQEYVAAWNQWADEPVPVQAVVRCLPGFMASIKLPDDVTTPEQAVAWAVETAKRISKKIIVVASRCVTYTVHEDGRVDGPFVATPDNDVTPYMAVGNKRFLFALDGIGDAEPYKPDRAEGGVGGGPPDEG
jgi:transcriptional regulator with XRE-family HTH domain